MKVKAQSTREVNILLVEDTLSDVRLVQEALKSAPVQIQLSVARDGVEAMDYLSSRGNNGHSFPDLILLDLNLPRKNGREVLSEIKQSARYKHIPVLVMTSSSSDDDITRAYELNANCYITKPFDLDDYVRVVRSIEDFWMCTATLPETHGVSKASRHPAAQAC